MASAGDQATEASSKSCGESTVGVCPGFVFV